MAMFHIKPSNSFAIWDVSRPGHPRHVGFEIELPRDPWQDVIINTNRSKWLIEIREVEKTNYIYVNLSSTRLLKNSAATCECAGVQGQACLLERNKQTVKAGRSAHQSRINVYYFGDRYLIQKTWNLPDVHIIDSWTPREEID